MRRRAERGFTLIELIVAMTLLGLVSVMIFGGLRFGSRTWERTMESSESLNAVVATHRFLRARLSESVSGVAGEPQGLAFESVWLSALGAGGLYLFELDLAEDGALVLSWRPADEEEPPEELVGERALLEGVAAIAISYFGFAADAEEPEWRDDWDGEDAPPSLVRVDLAFEDARRVWPPLIVALPD